MSGQEKLRRPAGGSGAAGVAGCAQLWGLRSPQWGQWVRRCAASRQTQWFALQGRNVRGSCWAHREGTRWLAVSGTCGQMVAWGHGGLQCAHAGGRVCGSCGAHACRSGVVRGGLCAGLNGGFCVWWSVAGWGLSVGGTGV